MDDKRNTTIEDPIKDIEAFEYNLFNTDGDESYNPVKESESEDEI